jgi:formylglycine-generating enzyme required for sulfatase activity
VTLSPFFLSKYEMTQGQWLRFVGRNPSLNNSNLAGWRADLVHPVESVSWAGCAEVLGRLGLELPSEAQWEYGARAGTTTVWWTGNDKQTLSEAGNVSDSYAKVHGGHFWPSHELDIDDGYTEHARVGSDRANSFGLHGVIGNVWEWCEDGYQSDFFGQPSKRYRVPDPAGSSLRVDRGGSYSMVASFARSAYRNLDPPSHFASNLGVRPGRRVRP